MFVKSTRFKQVCQLLLSLKGQIVNTHLKFLQVPFYKLSKLAGIVVYCRKVVLV